MRFFSKFAESELTICRKVSENLQKAFRKSHICRRFSENDICRRFSGDLQKIVREFVENCLKYCRKSSELLRGGNLPLFSMVLIPRIRAISSNKPPLVFGCCETRGAVYCKKFQSQLSKFHHFWTFWRFFLKDDIIDVF